MTKLHYVIHNHAWGALIQCTCTHLILSIKGRREEWRYITARTCTRMIWQPNDWYLINYIQSNDSWRKMTQSQQWWDSWEYIFELGQMQNKNSRNTNDNWPWRQNWTALVIWRMRSVNSTRVDDSPAWTATRTTRVSPVTTHCCWCHGAAWADTSAAWRMTSETEWQTTRCCCCCQEKTRSVKHTIQSTSIHIEYMAASGMPQPCA